MGGRTIAQSSGGADWCTRPLLGLPNPVGMNYALSGLRQRGTTAEWRGPGPGIQKSVGSILTTTERDSRTRESSEPVYEANQDGCRFATTCLDCPLPSCYYGDMNIQEQREIQNSVRDKREDALYLTGMMRAIYEDGLSLVATAQRLGTTWAVIRRVFARSGGQIVGHYIQRG